MPELSWELLLLDSLLSTTLIEKQQLLSRMTAPFTSKLSKYLIMFLLETPILLKWNAICDQKTKRCLNFSAVDHNLEAKG